MEPEQFEDDVDQCADCGATSAPDIERVFAFGERRVLCFECAIRRKGEYDEREDRWTVPPDVTGLEQAEET